MARAQKAAGTLGLHLHILKASSEGDLDAAFAMVAQLRVGALITTAPGFKELKSKASNLVNA